MKLLRSCLTLWGPKSLADVSIKMSTALRLRIIGNGHTCNASRIKEGGGKRVQTLKRALTYGVIKSSDDAPDSRFHCMY